MTTAFFLILFLVLAGLLWVRFAPINRDDWHVDPAEAEVRKGRGLRFIGREAPRYPAETEVVLANFAEIAEDEPNTWHLEGDLDEGMMTFVSRSKVLGLPEIITVKAVSEGRLTKLSIVSRARYGVSGARRGAERLDRWLQDMRLRLGQA